MDTDSIFYKCTRDRYGNISIYLSIFRFIYSILGWFVSVEFYSVLFYTERKLLYFQDILITSIINILKNKDHFKM